MPRRANRGAQAPTITSGAEAAELYRRIGKRLKHGIRLTPKRRRLTPRVGDYTRAQNGAAPSTARSRAKNASRKAARKSRKANR